MLNKDKLAAAVFRGGGIGYDTVCSLHSHNIETYLLTSKKLKDGKYPGARILMCPSHLTSDGASKLVTFLNTNLAPGRKVVLIPTSGDSALFLAQKRRELDERFLYVMPDASVVDAMDNKMLFYELCEKYGMPYAKTQIVHSEQELDSIIASIEYPSIVKPFRSRDWPESAGYKVQIVTTVEDLRKIVLNVLSHGYELLVQDMIPGGPETIFFIGGLYDENSNPVKLYMGQKLLQYPLEIGSTSYGRLTWKDELVRLSNDFIKAAGYSGLVGIEFKYDQRDETYKMIEINPRSGLFHRISSDGVWDISSFYVFWISGMGNAAKDYKAHEDNRRWIYPHAHLCSCIEDKGFCRGVRMWLRDMRQTKLRCAWDIRDIHRDWHYMRVVFGHIRRLGIRTLVFGKNSNYSMNITSHKENVR
jgi:D-aspartate ligase